MTKYKLIIFSTLCFVCSCGNVKNDSTQSEYDIRRDKQNQLDSSNEIAVTKLSNTYEAISGWDTTEEFTYLLQETFLSEHKPISFVGTINDIIKKDSSYILQVYNTNYKAYKHYNAEIMVSPTIFDKFKQALKQKGTTEGCFVFQVKNVISSNPILGSEVDFDGDNVQETSSHITLDFDETLITFKGVLIDYFLYDEIKNEE